MITFLSEIYNTYSQEQYDKEINNINFNHLICPCCNHKACFVLHGRYKRKVKTSHKIVTISIMRVKCTCNHTHSIMPSSIIPYSQVLLSDQIKIIENVHQALDDNPNINESNARYIIKNYNKRFHKMLYNLQIKINNIVTIIKETFDLLKINFMQIKRCYNILIC